MKPLFNSQQRKAIRTANKVTRAIFASLATALVAEFVRLIASAVREKRGETRTIRPTEHTPKSVTLHQSAHTHGKANRQAWNNPTGAGRIYDVTMPLSGVSDEDAEKPEREMQEWTVDS